MVITMQEVNITVEWNGLKVTVYGISAGMSKEDLRNLFERALCAVYTEAPDAKS